MSESPEKLDALIESVVEGRDVDWESARSRTADRERRLIEQLRLLARIGSFAKEPEHLPDLVPGGRWGTFELLERLGRGASGEVWRARDLHLDRAVALKLLPDVSEGSPPSSGSMVVHEGHLLSRVRHPNVVTVFGAARQDGRAGLWMECIDGRTLADQLSSAGPFDPREAASIGVDLCRALTAVHAAGLVHRDVKAQNVMRDAGGRTVLMDLGVGVDMLRPQEGETSAGTPLYLAPELFEGAAPSAASDIYSLGVLLFNLVTGVYPVRGATSAELRRAHALGERAFLRDLRTDLPDGYASVVERALQTDRVRRFGSAREMEKALTAHMGQVRRSRAYTSGAVLAGSFVILVVVIAAIWSPAPPPPVRPNGRQITWELTNDKVWGPGAISSDGSMMAFNSQSNGVHLLDLETGVDRPLVSSTEIGRATDTVLLDERTEEVIYGWYDDECECAELRKVPFSGGASRTLTFPRSFASLVPVDLASDGVHLLVKAGTQDDPTVKWSILDLVRRTSTEVMADGRNVSASLSPDARLIAYSRPAGDGDVKADVFLLDWRTGKHVSLVDGPSDDAIPLWTPDNRSVVFLSDRAGGNGLWRVTLENDRARGEPSILQRDMGRFIPLRLSPGGILSYWRSPILDIELAQFDPEQGSVVGNPRPAPVRIVGANTAPSWSPDGTAFVYSAERKPIGAARSRLVIHSRRDNQEREVAVPVNGYLEPAWSPDGKTILIRGPGVFDDERGAHVVDVTSQRTTARFRFPISSPLQWARDGLSFVSIGPESLQRMYLDAERPERINVAGGWRFSTVVVSPDGREIAGNARGPAGRSVIVVDIDGSRPRVLAGPTSSDPLPAVWDWTPDGRFLLAVRPVKDRESTDGELVTIQVRDGHIAPAGLVKRGLAWVRVSPDGREILYRTGLNQRTLWLMERLLPE